MAAHVCRLRKMKRWQTLCGLAKPYVFISLTSWAPTKIPMKSCANVSTCIEESTTVKVCLQLCQACLFWGGHQRIFSFFASRSQEEWDHDSYFIAQAKLGKTTYPWIYGTWARWYSAAGIKSCPQLTLPTAEQRDSLLSIGQGREKVWLQSCFLWHAFANNLAAVSTVLVLKSPFSICPLF